MYSMRRPSLQALPSQREGPFPGKGERSLVFAMSPEDERLLFDWPLSFSPLSNYGIVRFMNLSLPIRLRMYE